LRRVSLLRPELNRFRFFHDPGIDVVDPADSRAFFEACDGSALVVLDTITAFWTGDENDKRGDRGVRP
jgi:hypothetical protein